MTKLLAASWLLALGAVAGPAAADGLEPYRWKARPVVIFAPSHGDRQTIDQLARLRSAAADLADRDMPVLVVTGRDVADLAGGEASARPDGAQLRRRYGVSDDAFAVLLIGKDGGEKLKSGAPVDPGRMFSLVDDMPMRRDEVGARTAN